MSFSPPIRRLSNTNSSSKEDLINAYEAEEERIINVLSRKLEQLREEKIDLENALEAESESHVNRMARELTALRLAQQGGTSNSSLSTSPEKEPGLGFRSFMSGRNPGAPSAETMLEAMRRENEQLRSKLVETERDYIRISRLNEVYREELIDHRRRLGIRSLLSTNTQKIVVSVLLKCLLTCYIGNVRLNANLTPDPWRANTSTSVADTSARPFRPGRKHPTLTFAVVFRIAVPIFPSHAPQQSHQPEYEHNHFQPSYPFLPVCAPAITFFVIRIPDGLLPYDPRGPLPPRAIQSAELRHPKSHRLAGWRVGFSGDQPDEG
ncbi:hypothetical protein D9615_005016 [Tricholomella constricta]|uniref:Uncharacterized protein n=1 Tax=Tricholomella constricta TaxID=117010 RepID=A0A8H5HGZ9_9AGAR|nr:hypothetical protein D9615_005016 [Tricholomella constricta]